MHPTQSQPNTAEVDTTPARVLRDAATYLDRHGWTQTTFYTYRDGATMPAACALGAIRMAVYGYPVDCSERLADPSSLRLSLAAIRLLGAHIGFDIDPDDVDPVDEIAQWNDRSDRTRFDITEALRAAAYDYDVETYGDSELDQDRNPTTDAFLAWHAAQGVRAEHTGGAA